MKREASSNVLGARAKSNKILVYGFEPFGGLHENSSQQVVRALERDLSSWTGSEIEYRVLPVNLEELDRAIGKIDSKCLRAVVGLGVQKGLPAVKLEEFASNRVQDKRENGRDVGAKPIDPLGPRGLFVTCRIEHLCLKLHRLGIPAFVSVDAGDYACNFSFYKLLNELGTSRIPIVFLHLPFTPGMAIEAGSRVASLDLNSLVEAARAAVQHVETIACERDAAEAMEGKAEEA